MKREYHLTDREREVLDWHLEHFSHVFPEACLRKASEELGELHREEFRIEAGESRLVEAADEVADVVVCLIAWAARRGVSLESAVARRWAEVQRRTPRGSSRRMV